MDPRTNGQPAQPKVRKEDPQGWFVICLFAIMVVIIVCAVIYLIELDIKAPIVQQRCNPGVCKFDVFTGVKTCPAAGDTTGIQLEEGPEFCTSADYCQHPGYSCAVLADQTLNCDGTCDVTMCRCVQDPSTGAIIA
jgi:hypothetical protein